MRIRYFLFYFFHQIFNDFKATFDSLNIKLYLIIFLKKTSLKDKFFKEIDNHLMNYYLNINGTNEINPNKKITDFFN